MMACSGLVLACGGPAPRESPEFPVEEGEGPGADREGEASIEKGEEVSSPSAWGEGSLHALEVTVTDATGKALLISSWKGHPVLLSMFYTSCPAACPLLIRDLQAVENELSVAQRENLRVLLISMDPGNDTPEALSGVSTTHHLDLARWTVGTVPQDAVRTVAAALGVRYRPLPEGGFAHTSVITLMDREGRIRGRVDGSQGRPALMRELKRLTALQTVSPPSPLTPQASSMRLP